MIWHNLKYDLEILELFQKNTNSDVKNENNKFWQMSFEV
jgi:hypothetical protein